MQYQEDNAYCSFLEPVFGLVRLTYFALGQESVGKAVFFLNCENNGGVLAGLEVWQSIMHISHYSSN